MLGSTLTRRMHLLVRIVVGFVPGNAILALANEARVAVAEAR
jgi:hypothetical protein